MKRPCQAFTALCAMLAVVPFVTTPAHAGDHRYPLSPSYVQECGSCHVAYPPALLTAADWTAIMNRLDRHFGTDASLEPKTLDRLAAELQRDASRRIKHTGRGQPPRLTRSVWFEKEHGPLPERKTVALPAAAQCESCHSQAAGGDYAERGLTLPPTFGDKER